jgi:D-lactate dehydrogenase
MMKIFIYEVRADEEAAILEEARRNGVQVQMTKEVPTLKNADLAKGYDGVSILGQGSIDKRMLDRWWLDGVRYLSTRTIGYDHIDINYAKHLGMRVCNACYEPNGVADFTVMMMLMCLRQYKQAMWRGYVNDFSLGGLQGKEMRNMTVGVIGTGRIGSKVIQNLSGFGCRILACSQRRNPLVEGIAEYVDLDTLYKESDIITIHVALVPNTRHMINQESLKKMKDGVILINCARGELADIHTLVEGIETKKIGALGIDTLEGEQGIVHKDHRVEILANREWFYLHQFRNVIMTQHMAFYTEEAVESMVECGIEGICKMADGGEYKTELTKDRKTYQKIAMN